MSYFDDPNVLRQIIMDHYQYPRNHALKQEEGYKEVHMASESCIDDIKVQAKFSADKIEDICFDGVACTIATASTSIMTELLVGQSLKSAHHIIDNYMNMVDEKEYDADLLEEAIAFKNVSKQANRIKCATIGWKAISELIQEEEGSHE